MGYFHFSGVGYYTMMSEIMSTPKVGPYEYDYTKTCNQLS